MSRDNPKDKEVMFAGELEVTSFMEMLTTVYLEQRNYSFPSASQLTLTSSKWQLELV